MRQRIRSLGMLFSIAIMALGLTLGSEKAAAAEFYKGKVVTIFVSFSAGGGYDAYSRTLARYISKHIPGNPTIVVKNMPGAGGLRLSNYLYNKAPKDGTEFGTIARGMPTHALLGQPGSLFDPLKFNWIGSMNSEVSVCATRPAATSSFAELRQKETVVGAQGAGSDSEYFAFFIQNLLGAKIKMITGYPGTSATVLAMDRGEVDGICGWSWSSVKKMKPKITKDGKVTKELNILLQMSLLSHPELKGIPLITEFAENDDQRAQMELLYARQAYGRPFVAPPGVPADRIAILRKAFLDTLADPALIAEAKKTKRDILPLSGQDVHKLIAKVLKSSPEVVAALQANLSAKIKPEKVKLKVLTDTAKVTKTKSGNRKIYFMKGGKEVVTGVSGSRTKVTVNGSKAKRKAIKVGMTCTFKWLGPGSEAKKIDCK